MYLYIISLGCAKNLVDSENMTDYLLKAGYVLTDNISEASLVVINTCGFIRDAKKESIEVILNALQEKPKEAKVVVYGCLVQRYQRELEELIPEADLFLPVLPYKEFAGEIMKHFPPLRMFQRKRQKKILFTPPSYTYIKISEGCRNSCSYCAIPFIRGPLRSFPVNDIVRQINKALDKGVYEINLIAQDITAYGTDIYGRPSLDRLLKNILSIKSDFWLRLLYLYPSRISPELIKIIQSDPRIVKYVDIPIQHVNNRILKLMNRNYTKKLLLEKIGLLREKIPTIAIRTSIIVGFPTEKEEDFQELADFVQQVQFENLGVFEYSPEEETQAFSLKPHVPFHVKKRRKKILMDIQKKLVKTKNRSLKGKIFPCLIELPVDEYGGVWTGRMYSQAPEIDGTVYITNYSREKEKIANVRMKSFKDYDLIGECLHYSG
jgi:ribosomal protein S12 methylthiotransferase